MHMYDVAVRWVYQVYSMYDAVVRWVYQVYHNTAVQEDTSTLLFSSSLAEEEEQGSIVLPINMTVDSVLTSRKWVQDVFCLLM